MTVLRSKMAEHNSWRVSNPIIISRKLKGVVHEKSVKMQLLPILLQIKSPTLIWIESLSSKDDRPHFKNGRAQLVAHQQPYHYIGEIVKVGYWAVGAKMVSNQPRMVSNVVTT